MKSGVPTNVAQRVPTHLARRSWGGLNKKEGGESHMEDAIQTPELWTPKITSRYAKPTVLHHIAVERNVPHTMDGVKIIMRTCLNPVGTLQPEFHD